MPAPDGWPPLSAAAAAGRPARPSGAGGRRRGGPQRLQEGDQVVDFVVRQAQRAQDLLAVRVQPVLVEIGVVQDGVAQARHAAVVHVRGGHRDVAQARRAELAPVARFEHQVPQRQRVRAGTVVVVPRQQVEAVDRDLLDAVEAPAVGAPRRDEVAHADVVELAVAEVRARVALTVAASDEQLQAALCGRG